MPTSTEAREQEAERTAAPAAYTAFRTFLGAIDALEHGIPKQIDRTIWRSQSGVVQSQIMMAFRFFGLVDQNDCPTVALQRLVDNPEKRHEHIRALLHHAYRDLIDHDLTKMSPRMLDEAMEQYHVSGDTKRKAVSFFLQAARFAELPMHPMLLAQIRTTSGTRRKRKQKEPSNRLSEGTASVNANTPQQGSVRTIVLRSGGTLTLSISADVFAMSAEDRGFIFGLIDNLQKYEKGDSL